jgi:hypothetical protein
LCSSLQSPVTSSLFRPNILLRTLFSNTLSLISSLNIWGQVSHPYKSTDKIAVLDILNKLRTGFFVHKIIISAFKTVEFVSDRVSYIILRGCWCNIVLNVHAPTENKIVDMKNRFYEELKRVFDKFQIAYKHFSRRFLFESK